MKKWKILFIVLIVISPFIFLSSFIAYSLVITSGVLTLFQTSLIAALILYQQSCCGDTCQPGMLMLPSHGNPCQDSCCAAS